MNIEDIQTNAVNALKRVFEVAAAGTPVLIDDGTYPKVDGREEYLRTVGLCIVVTPANAVGLIDQGKSGAASFDMGFHVIVEENVTVNRGTTGTGVVCEKAAGIVMEGLCGRPNVSAPNSPNTDAPFQPFRLDDPPLVNFGTTGGLRQTVINFLVRCFVTPKNRDPQ